MAAMPIAQERPILLVMAPPHICKPDSVYELPSGHAEVRPRRARVWWLSSPCGQFRSGSFLLSLSIQPLAERVRFGKRAGAPAVLAQLREACLRRDGRKLYTPRWSLRQPARIDLQDRGRESIAGGATQQCKKRTRSRSSSSLGCVYTVVVSGLTCFARRNGAGGATGLFVPHASRSSLRRGLLHA